jgi:hypothetical protein
VAIPLELTSLTPVRIEIRDLSVGQFVLRRFNRLRATGKYNVREFGSGA